MRRLRSLPRTYVAGALAAIAASALLAQALERRIAERVEENASLRAAIAADLTAVAERAALSTQRERLTRELGPVLSVQDATARSAAFVREASAIARRHRTRVSALCGRAGDGARPLARASSRRSRDRVVDAQESERARCDAGRGAARESRLVQRERAGA